MSWKFIVLSCLLAAAAIVAAATAAPAREQGSQKVEVRVKECGARCSAPAVGACGSCAISCEVGKAARCTAGKSYGQPPNEICQVQASCKCE